MTEVFAALAIAYHPCKTDIPYSIQFGWPLDGKIGSPIMFPEAVTVEKFDEYTVAVVLRLTILMADIPAVVTVVVFPVSSLGVVESVTELHVVLYGTTILTDCAFVNCARAGAQKPSSAAMRR